MNCNVFLTHWLFRYGIAVSIVPIATALRFFLLQEMGTGSPYITFHPAVMIAALFGGISTGLLTTALSALTILLWSPTHQPFIESHSDWLGMIAFIINCILISLLSEAMNHAKRQAIQAKEQAEQANRTKSIFLANMSHELRTPLSAILGFSRLMKNAPDVTLEQDQNLAIILCSGEHLLHLINNILDIAKVESGQVLMEMAQVDLHYLLHEIKSMMYANALEKNLNFTIELPANLPHCVMTDSGKLRQILINLIGNALKFTVNGGVELKIKTITQQASEQLHLRFEIHDTGIGICEEDITRLFQPFVQLHNSSIQTTGTGLGLAICKQYVELMQGRIGVESKLGEGSVFYFELPVMVCSSIIDSPRQNVVHTQVIGLAEGQPHYRILIADDHADNRLLLHRLLEPIGFEVLDACNGQEAVEICQQWQPQLIFMDIRMPIMNGLEASKQIKAKNLTTKIVALTAHALEDERLQILAAGCDDVIRKPFQNNDIFHALEIQLDAHFRYAPKNTIHSQEECELIPDTLNQLPTALLVALHEAVILLDKPQCLDVIQKIKLIDHSLGNSLYCLINNLEYKKLLALLDKIT